jgi:hypothetical protein
MSEQEIKSNLCYYDPKNPNNNLDAYEDEDRPQPRKKCYCDNCFYGRDKLAMQLLEVIRKRDEAREDVMKLQDIKRKHEHEELVAAQENDRLKLELAEAREQNAKLLDIAEKAVWRMVAGVCMPDVGAIQAIKEEGLRLRAELEQLKEGAK